MNWYKAGYKQEIHVEDSKEVTETGSALDAKQANKNLEGTFAYDVYKEISEVKKSAADGKTDVASAISAMGQATSEDDSYSAMAADIRKISSDTTAGAGNILYGKTAYAGSKKITGSMPDMGAISYNMPANGSYTIPAGYHNGSGIVSQKIGTQGSQTIIPGTSDKYIGPGKYLTDVQTIKGDANLVPANIIKGKSIFGINGSAEACSKVKLVLGERTVLNSIISKTNISEAYTFTGGPDGIRWYNWRVPDGKVVLNTSGLLNSYVSAYWGVIIRSIDYGTQAQAAGKNGYTYGPLYYDDYWVPGGKYGTLDTYFERSHKRYFSWIYYSFDWTDDGHNSLILSLSNNNGVSSGDTWTQRAFTLYPVTGIDFSAFDAYDGSGFNNRDVLGVEKWSRW